VSKSNNLYCFQTELKFKTLLKNNGQYSSLYNIKADPWNLSGRSSLASIFGGKNKQWKIGGKKSDLSG
jgi:hypothetical protein